MTLCCDQYVKDTIWKQFTTITINVKGLPKLWPICQRYNLKAIHNGCLLQELRHIVVTNMSKIQFESNSQLFGSCQNRNFGCDQYVKDTIWKQFTTCHLVSCLFTWLWPICQRYNLKAIHNPDRPTYSAFYVVTNMSKIQFESNSQQKRRWNN